MHKDVSCHHGTLLRRMEEEVWGRRSFFFFWKHEKPVFCLYPLSNRVRKHPLHLQWVSRARKTSGEPDLIAVVVAAEGAGLGDNKKQMSQSASCRSSSKASIGTRKLVVATTYRAHGSRPYECRVPSGRSGGESVGISISWVVGKGEE